MRAKTLSGKNEVNQEEDDPVKPKNMLGMRHAQVFMLFIGMVLVYTLRVNMSVAIVAMTTENPNSNVTTFNWSKQTQDVILSSFFWGYVILQIPAGELASRFGSKIPITICFLVNSVVTLLLPMSARLGGWQAVCLCRVLQGLSQGLLFPAIHNFIAKWVPPAEKSRLSTIIYAGAQLGTASYLIASGFLGASSWGWPSIFYVSGGLTAIWLIFWIIFGASSPDTSKYISQEEKHYIQSCLGHVGGAKKYPTPWGSILTSAPFWALVVAHCGQNWGFWTLLTEIPSYMSQVLGLDIKSNGTLSALPYIVMYALSFVFGSMSDYIVSNKIVSITAARKISNSIGHWGPAVALLALAFAPEDNVTVAVALLTLAVGLNAGQYGGYIIVHIDMAPNFAGTLMGITNSLANVVSIIAPLTVGFVLEDETQASEWRKVFIISTVIYFVCNLFFVIFGTSKRQKWNEPKYELEQDADKEQEI